MTLIQALILGAVEGLTEFLPVSSTGHLILTAGVLHLRGEAVKTFEVVIQAGALGAVLGLYRNHIVSMVRGVLGKDSVGFRLFTSLTLSFLPAAITGLFLHHMIKERLFGAKPVTAALALGGVAMILVDGWVKRHPADGRKALGGITGKEALIIGFAQCLSLWPGTSRAMVTMVAGLLLGWPATMAAEYSFLLALPTLGAATLFDAIAGGQAFLNGIGGISIAAGFVTAGVIAALAIQGFIQYLTRRGLAPFGWYRLVLAVAVRSVAQLG